jgi:peptide chain release factor subunit 1
MADAEETDRNVEMWKIKKLIKSLQEARGSVSELASEGGEHLFDVA